jgi:hypothetical protein
MFKISSITLSVVMALGASAASAGPNASAGGFRQSNTDVPNQRSQPYNPRGEL